jgi:hypothetical protein
MTRATYPDPEQPPDVIQSDREPTDERHPQALGTITIASDDDIVVFDKAKSIVWLSFDPTAQLEAPIEPSVT